MAMAAPPAPETKTNLTGLVGVAQRYLKFLNLEGFIFWIILVIPAALI